MLVKKCSPSVLRSLAFMSLQMFFWSFFTKHVIWGYNTICMYVSLKKYFPCCRCCFKPRRSSSTTAALASAFSVSCVQVDKTTVSLVIRPDRLLKHVENVCVLVDSEMTLIKCFCFSNQRWATDRQTSTKSSTEQRVSCESCCKCILLYPPPPSLLFPLTHKTHIPRNTEEYQNKIWPRHW